jgi:hypothetical protein
LEVFEIFFGNFQGRAGLLGESAFPGSESLDWILLEVFEIFFGNLTLLLDEGLVLIFLKNLSISSSQGCVLWVLELPIR